MKQLIFIALLILPFHLLAQKDANVNVAKDGLVTVNGKKAFYMIAKGDVPWERDYAVENLQHEQLAYFKFAKGYRYTNNVKSHMEVEYYVLTIDKDGAHCEIRDYMKNSKTIIKSLAIVITNAGLIKKGAIDEDAEKKFIEKNEGFLTPAKATPKKDTSSSLINNTAIPHADDDPMNGKIVLKEGYIYYDQQKIGNYHKVAIDTDLTLVQVHSINKNKVAEATHEKGAGTWTVITIVDQEKTQLPYDGNAPLQELFRYLLKKRYL